MMGNLSFHNRPVKVPPIKCQGIKTKLVPFIFDSIKWESTNGARWIEPFLGSGSVALNLAPERALVSDANPHIINFYKAIQRNDINQSNVREFLTLEGEKLAARGADYYYEVRERFNERGSPFDFLFLNRSCFNGVMRFNSQGRFNVPFGHKPQRFSRSYITKIVNQIGWVSRVLCDRDWEFRAARWEETLSEAAPRDFVYLDPPYIGRHTDYYNSWTEADAVKLASGAGNLSCGFALSMWMENRHRKNTHIDEHWSGLEKRVCRHFYHVGPSESLRNEMDEAIIIKPGYAAPDQRKHLSGAPQVKSQMRLSLE